MSILLISASPSNSSRSALLLAAAGLAIESAGFATFSLKLRELPADALLDARVNAPEVLSAVSNVAAATAIVIATPIYKASYSGLLKVFLDLLPQCALKDKWVWPLATGGSAAHTTAIDYSLRPVLDNLGAKYVLPSVFALDSEVGRADNEGIVLSIQLRVQAGAERLADAINAERYLSKVERARHRDLFVA